MRNENVVEIVDVSFGYDRGLLLDKVNLCINSSDFLGIVGPNGSGKSTLIKLMLGLLKPQSGKVLLFGQEASSFSQWSRLGYLSQKATSFNPNFPATVREVVGAHAGAKAGLWGRLTPAEWDKVDSVIARVGLADFRHSLVGKLSGGQQQRVFLARLLVNQPEVVLLDEPLVGIDTAAQESLQALLEDLHRNQKLTVIMVTHDIAYASNTANRLVCIHQQKIFEHNPLDYPQRMVQEHGLSRLYHFH